MKRERYNFYDKCNVRMPWKYLSFHHGSICFPGHDIDSAATSREEIGNPPHYGTVNKLRQVGVPVLKHRAAQLTKADYDKYDYIIGMDTWNIRNMMRILDNDPKGKVYKLLSFAGRGGDIADPSHTGNFDETYSDVVEGCNGFTDFLIKEGKL